MESYVINAVDTAIRRYHTRDPFEIIAQRKVKLRYFTRIRNLLGYYSIRNNTDYIGINACATPSQQRSAAGHEVGHLIMDRDSARTGTTFQDTYLYSVNNQLAERRANFFAAELLMADEDVLEPIGYYAYIAEKERLESSFPTRCTPEYRALKYHEMLQELYYIHEYIETTEEIAARLIVEPDLINFKIKVLDSKGFKMPQLPELKSDFLKDSMKKNKKAQPQESE